MGLRGDLGIEDDLDEATAIAEVDEDQPAVVAATVHPTSEGHLLAAVLFPEVATIMGLIMHFRLRR